MFEARRAAPEVGLWEGILSSRITGCLELIAREGLPTTQPEAPFQPRAGSATLHLFSSA